MNEVRSAKVLARLISVTYYPSLNLNLGTSFDDSIDDFTYPPDKTTPSLLNFTQGRSCLMRN